MSYRKVYFDFQTGDGFEDVTDFVKYDDFTYSLRAGSDNFHYAQNTANLSIIYDATLYNKIRTNTKDIKVRIVDSTNAVLTTEEWEYLITEDGFYLATEAGFFAPVFYGHIAPTKSHSYNGIINNTILKLEAIDDGDYLDKEVGDLCYRYYAIMNPLDKDHSIVHQLAYRAGYTDLQVDDSVFITTVLNAFAPPSTSDKIKDLLDALLFEYGYTLNLNTRGQISPVKWMHTDGDVSFTFDESNIIDELDVTDNLKEYDGAEVVYYELGEGVTTSGQTDILLYRDGDLPYASDGSFLGYAVLSGYTYPPLTNVVDETTGEPTIVYQKYEDTAIKYWTNKAITEKLDYNYKAFTSDFSSIVATSGWYLNYKVDDGVELVRAEFENTQARIVFSGFNNDANLLYYCNVYGKVLYKTSERTSTIVTISGSEDLDEYVSTFIFEKEYADRLCKFLALQHATENLEIELESEESVPMGSLVQVTADDGTDELCYVFECKYIEKTGRYSYVLRSYMYGDVVTLPALTGQTASSPSRASGVTASPVVTNTAAVVATSAPKYLGRYEAVHPVSYNDGDWWTIYDTDDDPIQRGVWWNSMGGLTRVTASGTIVEQAKFSEALTDVAWAEAQSIYGTAANYGLEALFQSLGAVSAFFTTLFAQDINATGTITGAVLRSADRYAMMANEADDEDGYKGVILSSTPIDQSSPSGSMIQMANLYNLLGSRVPSLAFQKVYNDAWRLLAYISGVGNGFILKNKLQGITLQLGSLFNDGYARFLKESTDISSSSTSTVIADVFTGKHNGTRPSSVRFLQGAYQQNAIFDAMSSFIAYTGSTTIDAIQVTGAVKLTNTSAALIVSRAVRTSATTIVFYGVFVLGDVGSFTVTDGDTVNGYYVSISW